MASEAHAVVYCAGGDEAYAVCGCNVKLHIAQKVKPVASAREACQHCMHTARFCSSYVALAASQRRQQQRVALTRTLASFNAPVGCNLGRAILESSRLEVSLRGYVGVERRWFRNIHSLLLLLLLLLLLIFLHLL